MLFVRHLCGPSSLWRQSYVAQLACEVVNPGQFSVNFPYHFGKRNDRY